MKHRVISLLLAVMIFGSLVLSVAAAAVLGADVMPCYNNTLSTSTNFTISTTGNAAISAVYNAYPSVFTTATVTSYIEKRTLGMFWTRVDIGEPNNEWVDDSFDYTDVIIHEHQLDSKGTYRATVVYEIYGTGGAADVIDYEQERTYS